MRLRDADARLIHTTEGGYRGVETLAEADGVEFLCPLLLADHGTKLGVHTHIAWFAGVPQDREPRPGRWIASGTTVDDLTFTGPDAASYASDCGLHVFVRGGAFVGADEKNLAAGL